MYHSTLPFEFVLPAEWERQSGIMLTWPHAETDWKPYLRQITDTYLELADIIPDMNTSSWLLLSWRAPGRCLPKDCRPTK